MTPQAALLKASIDADVREIESLYGRLAQHSGNLTTTEQAILAGYYLHNLYNAFENICLSVAKAFENQVDREQWHSALLKRMTLDVEGLRPRLLGEEAYRCLDELRRFRHVFRKAYTVDLDPRRVALVVDEAERLQGLYKAEFERFKAFLDNLG